MGAESKKNLGIHLGLVLAEIICFAGFVVELYRARSGNTLSWAYVFEWPLFAAYAVYMWRKLLLDERGVPRVRRLRHDDDDEALDAYNRYLSTVHGPAPEGESRVPVSDSPAEASPQSRT